MSPRRGPLARGELEAMVLDALWDSDSDWSTPGEVHESLRRRRQLAYTTVMTTMTRLWTKGRLDRRKRGRAFEYCARESRTEYAASRMVQILEAAGDAHGALTHFVQAMDDDEVSELRRVMRSRRARP